MLRRQRRRLCVVVLLAAASLLFVARRPPASPLQRQPTGATRSEPPATAAFAHADFFGTSATTRRCLASVRNCGGLWAPANDTGVAALTGRLLGGSAVRSLPDAQRRDSRSVPAVDAPASERARLPSVVASQSRQRRRQRFRGAEREDTELPEDVIDDSQYPVQRAPAAVERQWALQELAASAVTVTRGTAPHTRHATGPPPAAVCFFVPASSQDAAHRAELEALLASWADTGHAPEHPPTFFVFTDSSAVFTDGTLFANVSASVARVYASLQDWKRGHRCRVLGSRKLRTGRATSTQLRGRGELSLPMFAWWTEQLHAPTGLFSHCDWFVKADTDT